AGSGHRLASPARGGGCRCPGRRAGGCPRARRGRRGGGAAAVRTIERLSPAEARARHQAGAVLVDVREPHERELGMADGAVGIARADLERAPADALPDPAADVVLICQGGARSLQCAEALRLAGYARVASVEGGTARWREDG